MGPSLPHEFGPVHQEWAGFWFREGVGIAAWDFALGRVAAMRRCSANPPGQHEVF